MEFVFETSLEDPWLYRFARRIRFALGRGLHYFHEPARLAAAVDHAAQVQRARAPGSSLGAGDVEAMERFMRSVQDLELRRRYFAEQPFETTFQGLARPLVASVLERDAAVASVLNIGVHYAYFDHRMACDFPAHQFIGVDFAQNLSAFNREFARGNLSFRSGYALELLECEGLQADLALLSSTAVVIRNPELRRYFAVIGRGARYLVINEPLYPRPAGVMVDPDSVPLEASCPVRLIDPGTGTEVVCFTHNYRAMAAAAGMEVLHYRVFRPAFTEVRMVQMVARTGGLEA